MVDASGSIRAERFPKVQDFLAGVTSELEVGGDKTRVGVVKFSDAAEMQFSLDTYSRQQDVVHAIRRMAFVGGRTHTASALETLVRPTS